MLKISELSNAKELDREAMKKVRGSGWLYGSGNNGTTTDKIYYAAYRIVLY